MSLGPTIYRNSVQACVLVLLFVLTFLLAAPTETHAQAMDSTLVSRFQLAESMIRGAQYQRAIVLLEDLVDRSPETHVFYERLRTAYENVKRFDDAIALVEKKIDTEAVPTIYVAEKARLLFLSGDEDGAAETWQKAIDTNPNVSSVYLLVYRSIMQVRMFELAIELLEQGRERLAEPALFQTDLAYLYSLDSQHDLAAREYLAVLKASDEQINFVRSRLSQFIQDAGALEDSIAETENAVAAEPLVRSYRELLGWLYMEAERYQDALQVYRAIDQLESENGRVLFAFAQSAAEAEFYGVAIDAFQEILVRNPDAPTAPDAVRGLGLAQEYLALIREERVYNESGTSIPDTGYHKALATYNRFLVDYPNHAYYPDVLRRIGRLQQDIFYQFEEAERILAEVVARYPQSRAADDAAFDISRLSLINGDLVQAEVQFSRLVSRLRTGDMADLARFELALIHFYRGQFDSAISLATALQENTSADVANDAIQLKLLISENRGPDSLDTPLHRFSGALLLKRQRNTDEALASIDLILESLGEHPLEDDLRLERAELLRSLGQTAVALQAYMELPLIHPESLFGDICLFRAGDIQENEMADSSQAIESYSRLLDEYPGSLLATEARARIRRLRGDGA